MSNNNDDKIVTLADIQKDFERERRSKGETVIKPKNGGETYACIEIEIPDDEVLLSDFDEWHCVLNRFLVSDTEEEGEQQDAYYETLPEDEKRSYMEKNWDRIFDITPFENDWTSRGKWVQAVFWELKKEQIRKVRFFKTAHAKN